MTINVNWPVIGPTTFPVPQTGETNWGNLTNYLVALGNAQSVFAQKVATRIATTSPVTVNSPSDCVIMVKLTVPGPSTVNLPTGILGQWFNISDERGDAGTNNITVVAFAGQTINGAPSFVINSNNDAITITYDGVSNWKVTTQILSFAPGSVARAAIQAGTPNYVVYNAAVTGLLAEEQYLATIRGGFGADVSAFTGVVKSNLGVFSASPIVNTDIDPAAGISASKISTGIVDNTEFNRLNELGLLYSTTKVTGGVGSVNGGDPAKFDVTAGTAKKTDYTGTPATPVITDISFGPFTAQTVTNLATADFTYVSVDGTGALLQQTTFPTPAQQRTNQYLFRINHSNRVSIGFIDSVGNDAQSIGNQYCDLVDALGPFNITGNVVSANGANLNFNKSAGQIFSRYFNQVSTPLNPHYATTNATVAGAFRYATRTTVAGATVTVIDPTNYDVGGVVTAIPGPGVTSTIQRVFLFPSNNITVQYGQNTYATLADAVAAVNSDSFVINPTNTGLPILIAYIVVQKNCVSLSAATCRILTASRFDTGAGGGTGGASTLQSAYNNSVSPILVLAAAVGAFNIRDNAAPLGTSLFNVQSNSGATTFMDVSVSGIAGNNFPNANRVLITDASSRIGNSPITSTEIGFLSGTTGVTGTGSITRSIGAAVTLWDFDGGTASNTSRLTVPKNTYANLLALTRKEGTILYATDLDVLFSDDGITLTPIGSSSSTGVLNIVDNPSAVANTTGWTAATNYTVTRDTSNSPLAGVIDSCFAISTTTASSETSTSGVYAAAQLMPAGLRNTKIQVNLYLTVPATSLGVWRLSVYNASGTRMSLSSDSSGATTLPAGFTGNFVCTFDADNSASYTITFTQTTRSSANTLYATNITIGPGITAQGAAISEWFSYTPTAVGFGSPTLEGSYRRVGSEMEIQGKITAGASTAVAASFSIPSGFTIGSSPQLPTVGVVGAANNPNGTMVTVIATPGGTTLQFATGNLTAINGSTLLTAGQISSFFARIPLGDWAGNGTQNLGPGAQVEYISSGGTWDADVTGTSYGSSGSPISGSLTAVRTKTITPQYPTQTNDILVLEYLMSNGVWMDQKDTIYANTPNATVSFGGSINRTSTSTSIIVTFNQFAQAGTTFNSTTGASNWASAVASAWRIRKVNASSPVGFGLAGTDGSAGLVAPYSAAGIIASGRWTPTITNGTNVASSSAFSCLYSRTGKIVTCSGRVDITTTTGTSTPTDFAMSLPIASNLAASTDLEGTGTRECGSGTPYMSVSIVGDSTNDRATFAFNSTVNASNALRFVFQYEII